MRQSRLIKDRFEIGRCNSPLSENGNSNLENVTQISPYLGGLGLASGAVAFNVACYYNTIIAWCLRYLMQVRFAVDYDYDGLGGCNIDNDGYDGDDNGDDDGDHGDDDGDDDNNSEFSCAAALVGLPSRE